MNKLIILSFLILASVSFGQNSLNNTRFFYNSIVDASINPSENIELNYISNNFSNYYYNIFQARGTYSLSQDFVLGAETSVDHSYQTPLMPFFTLGGRYNLLQNDFRLAFGGMIDIPISEDEYFISVFTSMRYLVSENLELAGSFRIGGAPVGNKQFIEDLNLGAIYAFSARFKAIAEMNMAWEAETIYLGGGLEYNLLRNFNLRGAAFIQTHGTNIYKLFFGASYNFSF